MTKLGKLKLNEFHEMNDLEMKSIFGGADSGYVTCSLNLQKTGCSDDSKGKPCKKLNIYAGNCAFTDYYGVKPNTCECK